MFQKLILIFYICNATHFINLFPESRFWVSIIRNIEQKAPLQYHIENYIEPFRYIQEVSNAKDLDNSDLCHIIESAIDVVKRINVGEKERSYQNYFDAAFLKSIKPILNPAEREKIERIIPFGLLRNFLYQNLRDRVVGSQSDSELKRSLTKYVKCMKYWRKTIKKGKFNARNSVKIYREKVRIASLFEKLRMSISNGNGKETSLIMNTISHHMGSAIKLIFSSSILFFSLLIQAFL